MSVKKESSGRRSVQVEVEVPGTPEEVWRAISTGQGISSWFVPTKVEERVGGKLEIHFGPGMDVASTITAWEPPLRFAAESHHLGEKGPAMASEWFVEARSGGTCIVRVVHSLFAETDDWDDQLEGTEQGWPLYFRVLRFYMEHFRGMQVNSGVAIAMSTVPAADTLRKLTESLGISELRIGEAIKAKDTPPLSGKIEWISPEGKERYLMLHLDSPARGIALVGASACGGGALACVSLYLFGEGDSTDHESAWQEWLNAQFPVQN